MAEEKNREMESEEWQTIVVEDEEEGKRIDKFLSEVMPDLSRSYIQKLFGTGNVKRNDGAVKPGYKLCSQDRISVLIPEAVEPKIEPEHIPLEILYEDEDVDSGRQTQRNGGASGSGPLQRDSGKCADVIAAVTSSPESMACFGPELSIALIWIPPAY